MRSCRAAAVGKALRSCEKFLVCGCPGFRRKDAAEDLSSRAESTRESVSGNPDSFDWPFERQPVHYPRRRICRPRLNSGSERRKLI